MNSTVVPPRTKSSCGHSSSRMWRTREPPQSWARWKAVCFTKPLQPDASNDSRRRTHVWKLALREANLLTFASQWNVCIFFFLSVCRLTHKDDCLDRKFYPLLTHKHRIATQKCAVCYTFIARCAVNTNCGPNEYWNKRPVRVTAVIERII